MNKYRMMFAPCSWSPQLRPWVVRVLSPLREMNQRKSVRLERVHVQGAAHVAQALAAGHRIQISPNHPSHADPFAIYGAAAQIPTPIHVMAAWHVFAKHSWLMRHCLRWHGCFSIDREANDLTAFRNAVDVLRNRPEPLVIFPEGEIYHCNDRVTPFREGAAAIALAAARKIDVPVVIVPAAIKYRYLDDPSGEILRVLGELETRVLWRPTPHEPVVRRIYRLGEAVLGLKELEYLGAAQPGTLPERIVNLAETLLSRLEERHQIKGQGTHPKRVKELRRVVLTKLGDENISSHDAEALQRDLEDIFLVLQLFSYPGDYLADSQPTVERIAETIDKLEEDVLQQATAGIRGRREAIVRFAPPIMVEPTRSKTAAIDLTDQTQHQVQSMLDEMRGITVAAAAQEECVPL